MTAGREWGKMVGTAGFEPAALCSQSVLRTPIFKHFHTVRRTGRAIYCPLTSMECEPGANRFPAIVAVTVRLSGG